jgi:uroporphyrinogen-III synthase
VAADDDLNALREAIDSLDVVTFTSASTVDNFYGKLSEEERGLVNARAAIASIGPVTSEAVRRYGKEPDVVAENATIESLHAAVLSHFQ